MYQLTYGNLTKYWSTIATVVVAIPIILLGLFYFDLSDMENPYALLLLLLPIAYNLYSDLKNYSKLPIYQISDEGIGFLSEIIPWSSIESYENFGSKVSGSRNTNDIKLLYASGILIRANSNEYIVYSSARNYKQFIAQLESKGVCCENA